jgi:hypothetical protein
MPGRCATGFGAWEVRYEALVPGKLTAADAKVLLDLIEENPKRFVEALDEFAALSQMEEPSQ